MNWQLNQDSSMVECQARDLKVRGSNPGPGSNFSLELKIVILQGTNYRFIFTCQFDLKISYLCINKAKLVR